VPLFTSGGLGLGLKNLVLFTSLVKNIICFSFVSEVNITHLKQVSN